MGSRRPPMTEFNPGHPGGTGLRTELGRDQPAGAHAARAADSRGDRRAARHGWRRTPRRLGAGGGGGPAMLHAPLWVVLSLATAILLAMGVGDTLFFRSMDSLGVTRALTLSLLNPLLTTLTGIVLYREPLTLLRLAGIGLVIGGLMLIVSGREEAGAATGRMRRQDSDSSSSRRAAGPWPPPSWSLRFARCGCWRAPTPDSHRRPGPVVDPLDARNARRRPREHPARAVARHALRPECARLDLLHRRDPFGRRGHRQCPGVHLSALRDPAGDPGRKSAPRRAPSPGRTDGRGDCLFAVLTSSKPAKAAIHISY